MICQKCGKNNATTHIHSVIGGIVKDIDLCSVCAAKEGYSASPSGSLASMLSSVFGDMAISESNKAERCPCCNSSFRQIANTGKAGCPKCYEKFKNELLPYLKRVHGSVTHIGKKPKKDVLVVSNTDKLSEMRKKLRELVKNENYEEAAVMRDKIKLYEEERNNE